MRIMIVGAGAVGFHLAKHLSQEGHDIVLIDPDPDRVSYAQDQLDILAITGNGASLDVLEGADIEKADMLVAVTNVDEVNLIACMSAMQYGVAVKVARISNPDYFTHPLPLGTARQGVDVMINPELEAARETYQLLQSEAASELAFFADGRVQLLGLRVQPDAPVVGARLEELARTIPDRRFLTAAISRGTETIIPRGDDHIEADDLVYIIGESREMPRVLQLAGYQDFRLRRVMIAGGTRNETLYLAQILADHDVDCTIIEVDRARCLDLAERLDKALVLNGDVTDQELLEMEGIEEVDGFVAFTTSDATNLLSSLLAKSHGAHRVVARLSNVDYIPLVNRVGIDAAVSPRLSTVNTILKYVRRGAVLSVAALRGIDAEVIEFRVSAQSKVSGKSIAKIHFPEHSLVGAIQREDQVIIPDGNTIFEPGDKVTVLALPDSLPAVEHLFG